MAKQEPLSLLEFQAGLRTNKHAESTFLVSDGHVAVSVNENNESLYAEMEVVEERMLS